MACLFLNWIPFLPLGTFLHAFYVSSKTCIIIGVINTALYFVPFISVFAWLFSILWGIIIACVSGKHREQQPSHDVYIKQESVQVYYHPEVKTYESANYQSQVNSTPHAIANPCLNNQQQYM